MGGFLTFPKKSLQNHYQKEVRLLGPGFAPSPCVNQNSIFWRNCETDEAGNTAFSRALYITQGHQIGYSCWYLESTEPFEDGSGVLWLLSRVEFHTKDGVLVVKDFQNEVRYSSLPSELGEDPIAPGNKEPIMNAFESDIDGESTGFYKHFIGGKLNYRSKHTLVNTGNGFVPGYCHRCVVVIFV